MLKWILWRVALVAYLAGLTWLAGWLVPEDTGGFVWAIEPLTIAALLSGAGALAGGVGGLLNAGGSSGGMEPTFFNANPGSLDLAGLFGTRLGPTGFTQNYHPSLGPTTSIFDDIGFRGMLLDFLQNPEENLALGGARDLFGQALDFAPSAIDLLQNVSIPTTRELAETGIPTDLGPIISERQRSFQEEFLPSVLETLPGTAGLFSSAFPNVLGREQARIGSELGALEVGLTEAATERRRAAATQLAELAAAGVALPANIASDLLGLGGRIRAEGPELGTTRALNLFSGLLGLGPSLGAGIVTGGFPTTDRTAGILGSLGESIPSLIGPASQLFNIFGQQTPYQGPQIDPATGMRGAFP